MNGQEYGGPGAQEGTGPILVSACLAGIACRFDGSARPLEPLVRMVREGKAIPVCPEVLGGLPTPRAIAEIRPGKGRVFTSRGEDVTEAFTRGAQEVLRLARAARARLAVFKERSPSCGVHQVYDGTFQGRIVPGRGIATAALVAEGIKVVSDEEFMKGQGREVRGTPGPAGPEASR